MNINQQMKRDRKKKVEEEKFNAIYKIYMGIGLLTIVEDLKLSQRNIQKYNNGVNKRMAKYFSLQSCVDDLARDLTKLGIAVRDINADENGNYLKEYEKYAEEE